MYANTSAFQLLPTNTSKTSSFDGGMKAGKWNVMFWAVGFAGGIAFSVVKKTGFLKGLGYTLLFGMAGGALGLGVDAVTKKDKK